MAEEGPVCNGLTRLPPSCHEARACYAALENRPETPYFGDTETEGFEMPKTKSCARARAAAIQADTTRLAVWLGAGALVIGALIARGF